MAGVTDLPFRHLAIENGCGLTVSEMVSAKGLLMRNENSELLLSTFSKENPFAVQLFGSDPEIMAEAAMMVEEKGTHIIDINMGCPVKKVVSTGAGSALLKDLNLAEAILSAIKKRITIPLTVKIRTGWDCNSIVADEMLKVAEDCGANALAVHARTRSQGYGGNADWSIIGRLKERATIPIFGNGDVWSAEDVLRMLDMTGCDGVMIGRGALGNPWIFSQTVEYMKSGSYCLPSSQEKGQVVLRHLGDTVKHYGEKIGVKLFRKHLSWYTKGMKGASSFRSTIFKATTWLEAETLIKSFFLSCSVNEATELNTDRFNCEKPASGGIFL